MKIIALIFLVSFCKAIPLIYQNERRVQIPGNGGFLISSRDGRSVIPSGENNILLYVKRPHEPTRKIDIDQNNEIRQNVLYSEYLLEYLNLYRGNTANTFRQDNAIIDIFREFQDELDEDLYQLLLLMVHREVERGNLHKVIYELLLNLDLGLSSLELAPANYIQRVYELNQQKLVIASPEEVRMMEDILQQKQIRDVCHQLPIFLQALFNKDARTHRQNIILQYKELTKKSQEKLPTRDDENFRKCCMGEEINTDSEMSGQKSGSRDDQSSIKGTKSRNPYDMGDLNIQQERQQEQTEAKSAVKGGKYSGGRQTIERGNEIQSSLKGKIDLNLKKSNINSYKLKTLPSYEEDNVSKGRQQQLEEEQPRYNEYIEEEQLIEEMYGRSRVLGSKSGPSQSKCSFRKSKPKSSDLYQKGRLVEGQAELGQGVRKNELTDQQMKDSEYHEITQMIEKGNMLLNLLQAKTDLSFKKNSIESIKPDIIQSNQEEDTVSKGRQQQLKGEQPKYTGETEEKQTIEGIDKRKSLLGSKSGPNQDKTDLRSSKPRSSNLHEEESLLGGQRQHMRKTEVGNQQTIYNENSDINQMVEEGSEVFSLLKAKSGPSLEKSSVRSTKPQSYQEEDYISKGRQYLEEGQSENNDYDQENDIIGGMGERPILSGLKSGPSQDKSAVRNTKPRSFNLNEEGTLLERQVKPRQVIPNQELEDEEGSYKVHTEKNQMGEQEIDRRDNLRSKSGPSHQTANERGTKPSTLHSGQDDLNQDQIRPKQQPQQEPENKQISNDENVEINPILQGNKQRQVLFRSKSGPSLSETTRKNIISTYQEDSVPHVQVKPKQLEPQNMIDIDEVFEEMDRMHDFFPSKRGPRNDEIHMRSTKPRKIQEEETLLQEQPRYQLQHSMDEEQTSFTENNHNANEITEMQNEFKLISGPRYDKSSTKGSKPSLGLNPTDISSSHLSERQQNMEDQQGTYNQHLEQNQMRERSYRSKNRKSSMGNSRPRTSQLYQEDENLSDRNIEPRQQSQKEEMEQQQTSYSQLTGGDLMVEGIYEGQHRFGLKSGPRQMTVVRNTKPKLYQEVEPLPEGQVTSRQQQQWKDHSRYDKNPMIKEQGLLELVSVPRQNKINIRSMESLTELKKKQTQGLEHLEMPIYEGQEDYVLPRQERRQKMMHYGSDYLYYHLL